MLNLLLTILVFLVKALKNLGSNTLDQPQSSDEEVRPATHKKHKTEDRMCFVPEEATTNETSTAGKEMLWLF